MLDSIFYRSEDTSGPGRWCEQKWPKTAAIPPLLSNPRFLFLTCVSVRFAGSILGIRSGRSMVRSTGAMLPRFGLESESSHMG